MSFEEIQLQPFKENKESLIVFKRFFEDVIIEELLGQLYSVKQSWMLDYGGEQFSLYQNYYAECNTGNVKSYHRRAQDFQLLLNSHFPTLIPTIFDALRGCLSSSKIRLREGFSGPGFVVFPSGEHLSQKSGPIHYDLEGLKPYCRPLDLIQTFSLVIMLQKPEAGGGLKVWDYKFSQGDLEEPTIETVRHSAMIHYEYSDGDFVLFNSLNAHQILGFSGQKDRVTLNIFGANIDNWWEVWF